MIQNTDYEKHFKELKKLKLERKELFDQLLCIHVSKPVEFHEYFAFLFFCSYYYWDPQSRVIRPGTEENKKSILLEVYREVSIYFDVTLNEGHNLYRAYRNATATHFKNLANNSENYKDKTTYPGDFTFNYVKDYDKNRFVHSLKTVKISDII